MKLAPSLLLTGLTACQDLKPDGHEKLDPVLQQAGERFETIARGPGTIRPARESEIRGISTELFADLSTAISAIDGAQCVSLEWTARPGTAALDRNTWVATEEGSWSVRDYKDYNGNLAWHGSNNPQGCDKDHVSVKLNFTPSVHMGGDPVATHDEM